MWLYFKCKYIVTKVGHAGNHRSQTNMITTWDEMQLMMEQCGQEGWEAYSVTRHVPPGYEGIIHYVIFYKKWTVAD